MSVYDDSCRWVPLHKLCLNRIAVVNQIHGCRYDYSTDNPCTYVVSGRDHACVYGGVTLARWREYDLETVQGAFDVLDALADALWLVRRAGYLTSVHCV